MPLPAAFANFNVDAAGLSVWLFKKSGGAGGAAPTYTGRWIATDPDLETALKAAVTAARGRIEEVNEYGLLAQNNEASALQIDTIETHADLIVQRSANALPQHKIHSVRQIQNSDFYAIRLTDNGQVLYAIRRTDASWKTARRTQFINVFFRNETLGLEPQPEFSLSKHIDFFILDDKILITDKGNFESVLNYKQAHADDFLALQAEPLFEQIFTNLAPLVTFVGSNKIQLRRVCAIRQKGHYRDPLFMARLRQLHIQYRLVLNFDVNGLLDPTPETCSDIITALLDHRLSSAFSENVYDVPDATRIN